MTTTAPTIIAGVSVLSRGGEPVGHPFDLGLSTEGIEIRRPGLTHRHMAWARVNEWELEERDDDVVLTLRGDGAVTRLRIMGWSAAELEAQLRVVTAGGTTLEADTAAVPAAGPAEAVSDEATPPQAESRRERRRKRRARLGGKAVLTVVLLLLLAAAVALVLLQSAGVIDWGFLGPTA